MGINEQMAADAAALVAGESGEWIRYNGARIRAVVVYGEQKGRGNLLASDGQADHGVIQTTAVDVPAPAPGDEIAVEADPVAGRIWRVARILSSHGGMHRLAVTAAESVW